MRGVRVGAVGLWLSVVAVGCVPSRDNPFDPKNAPNTGLRIVDITPDGADVSDPGARCGSRTPEQIRVDVIAAPATGSSSRSRCLYLDATASADPQGGALTLEYSWAFTSSSGDVVTATFLSTTADVIALNVAPLDESVIAVLPVGVRIDFSVLAKKDGAKASSSSPLFLTNERPVADAGPVRLLPLGGYPWTGDALTDLVFDGSRSSDPDGDALREFCWTVETQGTGDFETFPCSTDRTLTYSVDASEPAFIQAYLTVSDGSAESLRSFTSVLIGDPVSWVGTSEEGLYRAMDGRRRFMSFNLDTNGAPTEAVMGLVEIPNDPVVVARYQRGLGGPTLFRAGTHPDFGDRTLAPVTTLTDAVFDFVPDPLHSRVWSLSATSSGTRVRAWDIVHNPGSVDLSLVPGFPVLAPMELGFPYHSDGLVRADGTAWMFHLASPGIWEIAPDDPATVTITPVEAVGRAVRGLALRPDGGDEPWAITTLDSSPATPVPPGDDGFSHLVARLGETGQEVFSTGYALVGGLAWIDQHQFWTHVVGLGLVRVDATLLETLPGATFDDAIVQVVPQVDISEAQKLVADPVTGDCLIASFGDFPSEDASAYKRVRRANGEVLDFPPETGFAVFDFDRAGQAWLRLDPTAVFRGLSMRRDGGISIVPANPLGGVAADPSTGGLWIPNGFPAYIERRAPDGSPDLFFASIDPGTSGERAMPLIFKIAPSPDASRIYVLAVDLVDFEPFLEGYLVTENGLESFPVFGTTTADQLGGNPPLLEASAPVPSSTPFLWLYREDLGEIQARDLAPTPGVVSFPLGAEQYANAANSAADNHLCLATTAFSGTTTLYVRQLQSDGTVGAAFVGTNLSFARPSVAALGDTCWVSYSTPPSSGPDPDIHLRVTGPDGEILLGADQINVGNVTSISPINSTDTWVTIRRNNETGVWRFDNGFFAFPPLIGEELPPDIVFQGPGLGPTGD